MERDVAIRRAIADEGFDLSQPGFYTQPGEDHPSVLVGDPGEIYQLEPLGNPDLPIYSHKQEITDSVEEYPITFIVADTGVGKSTQVVQFLFETGRYRNINQTEPRRLAAEGVSARVRDEIASVLGESAANDAVSCQHGGNRTGPENAPIKVLTDGLQLSYEFSENGFTEGDVLIIDELHEWNYNLSILQAWTKKMILENPGLRIVIMSATINAEKIADHYAHDEDGQRNNIPEPNIIRVKGEMPRVVTEERPDATISDIAIEKLSEMQTEDGSLPDGLRDILIFVDGQQSIKKTIDEIKKRIPKGMAGKVVCRPLYSKTPPEEQRLALELDPDYIKVVVSTDIAQTSLTVPGVKYVIDCGMKNEPEVDEFGAETLRLIHISQTDCLQRKGRIGRIGEGVYSRAKLNGKHELIPFEERPEYSTPAILRENPERYVLILKDLGFNLEEFGTLDKASRKLIDLAGVRLQLLGALDEAEEITELGMDMNLYPLHPSSARAVIESLHFNQKIRSCVAAIVASTESGGLQYFAQGIGRKWKDLTNEESSDLIAQLDIFISAQGKTKSELIKHCREYDLDYNNIIRAQETYRKVAKRAGALVEAIEPPTDEEIEYIKRSFVAGHVADIFIRSGEQSYVQVNGPAIEREKSKRTVVTGMPDFVIARPYNIERLTNGESEIIPILENITAVSAETIGQVAISQTEWKFQEYKFVNGKTVEVQRQYLFGDTRLGNIREITAQPCQRLRNEIIAQAIADPGTTQRELRKTKSILEDLVRRSRGVVKPLSDSHLENLVRRAAPGDITNPATIEDNLRKMLNDPERDFPMRLDEFVSDETRQYILQNSPDFIDVEGLTLKLTYKKGMPIARNVQPSQILEHLSHEITLPDGRLISFYCKDSESGRAKKYTLAQLSRL